MEDAERPKIGLLVLDLDDTVWTWFEAWHWSFTAMLTELEHVTGLTSDVLLPAIKALHEAKGTVEYSWLLDELPLLAEYRRGASARQVFDSVMHAQNSARKRNTRLYPGVRSTLLYAKSQGTKIVAYTESLAFWTEWRMRLTGLDEIIDVLYSSPDHDFPEGETAETVRTLPAETYSMRSTLHKNVPRGVAKPDPRILNTIIEAHGVKGLATVYVGDSLDRDVEMAHKVPGVYDVHAKYGESFRDPRYELLRAVTHWKLEAVDKEKSADTSVKAKPSYILERSLDELLDFFDFGEPFNLDVNIELWREAVGVQMHFNDIGWRIRALALTVLTFTLGAVGFAYVNTPSVRVLTQEVSPAAFVPVLGLGLWSAFWFADRGWFHKLLYGAVLEGERLEDALTANGVTARLGHFISEQSPVRFYRPQSGAYKRAGKAKTPLRYRGRNVEWHSGRKLNLFYCNGILLLALATVGVLWMGPR